MYMGNLQQLAAGQEEIKKKMEEPLATVPSSLQPTDIQAIETSMLKAIAGVNSTTDLAIEGIAENMANLRKQIRDDYLPRIQKLEEIVANIGIKAEQSAPENTETLSKIGDLYTKVGNIMASYTQLQQGLQELQKGKTLAAKGAKSGDLNLSEIQEIVEEQVTIQREQLVAALKTHVALVEVNLRAEIKKVADSGNILVQNLEKRLESYGTDSGDSGGTSTLIGLEEKIRKSVVHMSHIKTSVDALWNSMGQLSAKIVDLEAEIDK